METKGGKEIYMMWEFIKELFIDSMPWILVALLICIILIILV